METFCAEEDDIMMWRSRATQNVVCVALLMVTSTLMGKVIYVDNQLTEDCTSGEYSIARRDNSGSDGNAYTTPQKAADVTVPGDTVYIREGTYYSRVSSQHAVPVMRILTSGTSEASITYRNYRNETAVFQAWDPEAGADGVRKRYAIELGNPVNESDDESGTGVQNIVIHGLIVEGASYSGLRVWGPAKKYEPEPNDPTENVTIRSVIARNNVGSGITTMGTVINVLIEYCESHSNWGQGIGFHMITRAYHMEEPEDAMSATRYSTIQHCLVYDNVHPTSPGNTDGTEIQCAYRCTVRDNVYFRNSDDGLDLYMSLECQALGNIICNHSHPIGNNCGLKFSAGGGGRHIVAGNIVFSNDSYGLEGSYPSNSYLPHYACRVFNNTCYGNYLNLNTSYNYVDYAGWGTKSIVRNNAFLACTDNRSVLFSADFLDSDYNVFSSEYGLARLQEEGEDANSLSGEGGIADPNSVIDTTFAPGWTIEQRIQHVRSQVRGAFSPLTGSILVDAGVIVDGYHNVCPGDDAADKRPWFGAAPDIGACEITLADIDNLSVSSTSRNSVTLTWAVPNSQGYTRQPTEYDIRYATYPLDESNWDAATQVQGEPVPGELGQEQSFTITDLNPNTTYHIALRTTDEWGNTSWLSNVVSPTTATSGNYAPVLAVIGDLSASETQTLTFTVGASDADGDTLTYSASGLPTGASFAPATRVFTWTPTNTQGGTHWVTFGVTDGQIPVTQTIAITVAEVVNNAPVLAAIGNKNVNEGSLLGFSVSATDSDGHSLTYSATGLPSGANFTGQTFTWVPTYEQAGTYSVTFTVTDGELTDSEPITITVANVTPDLTAPTAAANYPAADAIQVPVNPVIGLTVSDVGQGVDAGTVTIRVNDQLVYSGNAASYQSVYGVCRRTGTQASYRYAYQPAEAFRFDQQVSVRVTASDLAGNAMTPYNCSFTTEMRVFGDNRPASWAPDDADKTNPATVCDSAGNIWLAYHAGAAGQRDIYVSKLTLGNANFAGPIQMTTDGSDQCSPAIAIGSDDTLYVVWQDRRRGNWDIYIRTSADGLTWSAETRITDSDDNQIRPAIAVDSQSPNHACVAWQDDGAGNQDIYVATSSNAFSTKTISQVTANASDQTDPAIAVDASNTVYLVWADSRNGTSDVYGAASNSGPWTNVPVATGAGSQSAPVIATESAGTVLHVAWVDDAGTDATIRYASSDGMPSSPLAGTNIVDDTSGADQTAPSIATAGSAGNNLRVFLCWTDERNVNANGRDTDLYFVDVSASQGTNVLVGDGGTGSDQSDPAVGVDRYGYPYVLWTDSRNVTKYVYYAGSTYLAPELLESELVTASTGRTVGVATPTSLDDVSVVIPAGACPYDVTINIARLLNPQSILSSNVLAFDFGPSGLQFSQPVTVTIPYPAADYSGGTPVPCWYVSQTGTLSQQDITNIQVLDLSETLKALRFRTTHFTPYYLLESFVDEDGDGTWDGDDGGSSGGGGGGGGGGCSLSHASRESVIAFLLPYAALTIYMILLRRKDRKQKCA
jgi:hypothetical protein